MRNWRPEILSLFAKASSTDFSRGGDPHCPDSCIFHSATFDVKIQLPPPSPSRCSSCCCFSAIKLPEFSARTDWTDLALPGTGCLDGLLCLLVFCALYSLLCVCRWQWSSCRVECLCLCLVNLRVAAVVASASAAAAVPGTCSQLLGLCCFHYRPHGRLLNAKCADSQSKNAKSSRSTHCAPSSLL